MSLSSINLDAFEAVAQHLSFSKAAKSLFVTQSALSQRIKQLEEELGITLFIRNPKSVSLTSEGESLLRYCQIKTTLESEVVSEIKGEGEGIGGSLKFAGYSTVLRSVVIPSLAPMLRSHPKVTPSFRHAEIRELLDLLLRGEASYIVMDQEVDRAGVSNEFLGEEENVLVQSASHKEIPETYLDHDREDQTTQAFFKAQGQKNPSISRGFFDEIYAIMDGVASGIGKAIVPKHLADADARLKIVPGHKPLKVPCYLVFLHQPIESNLHKLVLESLTAGSKKILH